MADLCSSDRALRKEPEAAVRDRVLAPKERPILFSGPMVRAVLAGTKTQTRRALRGFCPPNRPEFDSETGRLEWFNGDEVVVGMRCPYGAPGDWLWVREAWHTHAFLDAVPPRDITTRSIHYAADGPIKTGKRRPGMFMPRWASRITLEVTGVRVERLQDISEADAQAEGCERLDDDEPGYVERYERDFSLCPRCGGTRLYDAIGCSGGVLPDTDCTQCDTYAKRYRWLWESINGPGSWNANPWVWVLSFRKAASGCSHTAEPNEQDQSGSRHG